MAFEILGYVTLPYAPVSICWNSVPKIAAKPKFEYIIATIGFGLLMINSPHSTPTRKRGAELELPLEVYAIRTDYDQTHVCVLPNGDVISSGEDKILKRYKQP
jgi:hypothetical protein